MSTVLLTGASGFLGAHTVQHLLGAGHHVRAYVRTWSRLGAARRPLGISSADEAIDVVQGNMTDRAAVEAAVEGCDVVVHAAATCSFRWRDRHRMLRENSAGTRTVLEAGRDTGCRHLVHVSSTVALASPGGATLDGDSAVGPGLGPYSVSKAVSERIARAMREAGSPVPSSTLALSSVRTTPIWARATSWLSRSCKAGSRSSRAGGCTTSTSATPRPS